MDGFNPYKYSTDVDETTVDINAINKNAKSFVFKGNGDALKINLDDIDQHLTNLRKIAHVPLNKLNKEQQADYEAITFYMTLLYKSCYYPVIHKHVVDHFGDLKQIVPGTVGSYFIGCHHDAEVGKTNSSCSPICAGSLPTPDPNWQFCQNQVVMATYENGRFRFDSKAGGSSGPDSCEKEVAYVYVAYTSINTFPGFSDDEKKELKRLGIKKVNLQGYTPDGTGSVDLGPQTVTIEQLRSRLTSTDSGFALSNGILVALLIVLIIMALFFAWRISQVNSSSGKIVTVTR